MNATALVQGLVADGRPLFTVCGLGHRDAYTDILVVAIVAPMIALILLATLFGAF
jgi:hypothetical protein